MLSRTIRILLTTLLALLWVSGMELAAQPFPIFNGTSTTCVGALLDSGGQGGSGYGNNENYTYTICPDDPTGAISLNFITFNLNTSGAAPGDVMVIHDGNSVTAPVLGTWTGSALQGVAVSASSGNSSGCLTIHFTSNATGLGVFAASITCYQPCTRPTAVATHGVIGAQRICPGESVTFNSAASYAAPGFSIATRRWDFGDGTFQNNAPASVSHTYSQPGGYVAQLELVDNNGCASTNMVDLLIEVGTIPSFEGTGGPLVGCPGETICLDGVVTGTTWTENPTPGLGSGVFLPDDVGSCFNSTVTYNQFALGQTLTNVNGLLSICMSMEHSFIGDLVITIISPTGQSVVMHQQGGGATYLGIPVDNDLTPNAQGTCFNYCFSPFATNGTWVDNAQNTLPSGTYESLNPLSGLVGSSLNGTWALQVCDLWAQDNGFICDWSMDFAPSLFADLIEFTPLYGAGCDSSSWSGANISSTSGNCNQICITPPGVGNFPYVYTVQDNFGCTYDTTITVSIVQGPQVNAGSDATTCGDPVQLGAAITSGGIPSPCNYILTLNDSYGDGWFGGSGVTITVNGVPAAWTLPNGSTGSVAVPVNNGEAISLNYTAAFIFNGEQSFTLTNSSGTIVYSSGNGPGSGLSWSGTANCPNGGMVYSWSPAAGLSDPNIANPIATVGSTTTYCVTVYQAGHPACSTTDCMDLVFDNPVDPGINGNITVCETSSSINLFSQLGGTPEVGGTWTTPSNTPHSGTFIPGTDVPGSYTYTTTGSGACGSASASATVDVVVNLLADAGENGDITVCSNAGSAALFAELEGTPSAGGTWSGPSPITGDAFDPNTMNGGLYTYSVPSVAPCPAATAEVFVIIQQPIDAGSDGAIVLCSSDAAASLFAQLGGTPAVGGTWTGPSAVVGGMIDPATMTAGAYTYTVAGTAPCPDETATVTVTINTPPDPGTDGTITLCSTDAAASLFAQLGGAPDAGGSWTGPSAVVGGMIDPATMAAGSYNYTVTGTAPCPDETSTVTVTINTPPDPGTDGTITLCSTDAAASLFAQLGGTPAVGGTWTGPSAVVGGMIDPATMTTGAYTYTVAGTAPCPDETATVTVTINTPPNAGTDGTITLCSTDAAASLFGQLGGAPDAGGTWSGPSAVVGGMIDPATMSAGSYIYTVTGTAPCPDETSTVTVTINTPPDPGTDGTITLCSTDAAASLFAQLGGTPAAGGTWTGPSAVVGGMIDPATMTAGAYTYTVAGTAPCPDETATVTVTINTPPNAGTDGTITLCSTDAAASLFAQLIGAPDASGTWTGPSAVVGGMIDPATMSAGDYTYTVTGTSPCPDDLATVTVTINTPPDPGTDGTITLCSTDAAASLFAQLGGTPAAGGTWTGPSAVVGGMIDPATMTAGAYTYTVAGTAPCPDETATVTVTINTPPDAGTDGTITLCYTDAAASLFGQLGGTPDASGTWTGPSNVVGGMIDPATMLAGVYTYTVAGVAPCADDAATVTVTINTPPDPGTDGTITLCSTDAAASLFAQLGGTPAVGGTWTGPSAVVGGMIDPATMTAGAYTYTVAGTAPCPDETATVTVTINTPPDPGTDGAITLCYTDAAASLFGQLGGTPDASGTWTGPSNVVGGMMDPATMLAGVYTYTVAGVAPCADDAATVTVTINTPPDPGTDGTITLCSTDAAASLFAQLGGTPAVGGTWTGPSAVVGGMIDPATMTAGAYTYTVAGTAPCPDETATVVVTINAQPNAGIDGDITLCVSSPSTSLFAALTGNPATGGTWTGPSAVVGGMFDPATMNSGDYTYTVTGTNPCPSDASVVSVSVVSTPDAGLPGTATLCTSDVAIALFDQLTGTPDAGGTWTGPSAVVGGMYDPATMTAGIYTYTITVPPPCVSVSSTVTITNVAPPNAGIDGDMTLCVSSPSTSLFAALTGNPATGGTWTGPSAVVNGMFDPATMNAGDYTYTIAGTNPCPSDASVVSVSVVSTPDAGLPGTATLCTSDVAIALFDQLTGTPDAGGTWTGPSAVVGGMYDPATMTAGIYTYTITVPPPCVSVSSTVTITNVAPPNAGIDGDITLCVSSPSTSLFAALTGNPATAGTWTGPSAVVGGMFDPATMNAGDYTYTVTGTTPCPSDASVVSVSVLSTPDAGLPGSATLCTSDVALALFDQLTGTPDPGGTWTGPSTVVGGMYDPATMTAGIYTYTITVPPPCVSVSSTVTITNVAPPNAGIDGDITLCVSSPSTSLFAALTGNPATGGTWTGPSAVVGGIFDPATMNAGDYTYTVSGTNPCPSDASLASVSVVSTLDAGLPGTVTLCTSDAAIALFDQLTGTPDAGGTWTGPSTVVGGMYDPATMTAGIYTYTIDVPPPCVSVSSTVTITNVAPPNAGIDGSLTVCISSPAGSLFDQLTGTPEAGGTWTGPSAVVGGIFDPATMNAGDYTYTVSGTNPCPSDASLVSVSVVSTPDAGLPGTVTLCTSDAAIALFDQLTGTPDAGGTWTGPSTVVGGMYDPATMTAGIYTYTIDVPPPCSSVSSTVTISISQPPVAGIDATLILCTVSGEESLFPHLGNTAEVGGTWSGPSAGALDGTFDPATDQQGIYVYTVAGTTPCPAAMATIEIAVVSTPDPGQDGMITVCSTDQTFQLFNQLLGAPDVGGTWTNSAGIAFGDTFDPSQHPSGIYTYTINAPAPCQSASSNVAVTVIQPPNAGIDGSVTLCTSGAAVDLFTQLNGNADPGGTWSGPNGFGPDGSFDPTVGEAGTYVYQVDGTTPCPADVSEVVVSLTQTPDAGQDATLNLCVSGSPLDIFPTLGGAEPGGSWTGPNNTPFTGIFTPGTNLNGNYTYTIPGIAPCPSASAIVTVQQLTDPDAGQNGEIILCTTDAPATLFNNLQGTPDIGGSWLMPDGTPFNGSFDGTIHPAGTYSYIIQVPPPCISDTAYVMVNTVQGPDAGEDGSATLCDNEPAIPLFAELGGTPDTNGAWTGPGSFNATHFTPGADAPGNYIYTVLGVTPCPNATAMVVIDVNPLPYAGGNGYLSLCPGAAAVSLFSRLEGTPDTTGTWTGPGGIPSNGIFDPSTDPQGTYTYTVYGILPCPNASATATVIVFVVPTPDAGPDAISCDLSYMLSASGEWATGVWSNANDATIENSADPSTLAKVTAGGNYTFIWSTTTADGCASSDTVNVLFTDPIIANVTVTDAICFGACDGTAAVAATGGNATPGAYTYTWQVAGAGDTTAISGLCAYSFAVNVADTNACSVTIPFIIDQPEPLTINSVIGQSETCPGDCDGIVIIEDTAGVLFSLNNGPFGTQTIFGDLCPGDYTVHMQNADGCVASGSGSVGTPPVVEASFYFDPDTLFTDQSTTSMVNASINSTNYFWDFAGLGTSTELAPTFEFISSLGNTYEVCLTAMDDNGCPDTYCAPLVVLDILQVFVPSGFTPNEDDINEGFVPVFNREFGIENYSFMVFNRWGEQIFSTEVIGSKWLGNYSGVLSKTEVYVWKVKFRDAYSGELYDRTGHVTLLK